METSRSINTGVRSLLLQHYPHLRPAEKKVATFLLHHSHNSTDLSLEQIAKCSGASRSAVVRMCQALGLKGFRAFQLLWAKEIAQGSSGNETSETPSSPPVFQPILNEFFKTEETLDPHAIERAADEILANRRVAICGTQGLSIVAHLANLWFSRIGLATHLFTDDETELPLPPYMDHTAVLIVLSMNGRNPHVLKLVQEARARHTTVISLLHYTSSPLTTMSDTLLACAMPIRGSDHNLNRARVAVVQLSVLEVLLEAVVRRSDVLLKNGEEMNR